MPPAATEFDGADGNEGVVIVLGAILLILGFVLDVYLLWVAGVVLLVAGAVFWVLGAIGRPVAGRRAWY